MDLSEIAKKIGLSDSKHLIRKAAELRRLCDVQFDSSVIGVGEGCKAVICLEITASKLGVLLDRSSAIRVSGLSEKAYTRSYNSLQNGLGVKNKLDVRELAIQFGCVTIIPFVQKASRRATADFTRPVFTAVAFYLSAKKQKGSCYKQAKKMKKHAHEDWRNSVVESIRKKKAACKPTRQTNLDFMREGPESHKLEVLKAHEPDQIAADTTVGDDFSNGDVD